MSARKRRWGFTLIELALVIVVLGILVAAGSGVISDSLRATRGLDAFAASANDARAALDRVARELRAVAYRTVDATGIPLADAAIGYGFLEATAGRVRFEKGDAASAQIVAICLLDGNLRLQVGGTGCQGSILLSGVTGLNFRYVAAVRSGSILSGGVVASCAGWETGQLPPAGACQDIRKGVRLVEVAVTTARGKLTTWAEMRSPEG